MLKGGDGGETIQDLKRRELSYQLINSALTLRAQTKGGNSEENNTGNSI
jgi:hypothetical protein